MPTGMGATNPKFAKSVRKPKKTEHYTFPEWWQRKSFNNEKYKKLELEQTILNKRNQEDTPKMKFGGIK